MSYRVLTDVMIPMRDGVRLATNIWLPEGEKQVPALLERTPYNKEMFVSYTGPTPNVFELVRHGYALVIQDCRGTFASEGEFEPHLTEGNDGADTLDWISAQDWCDGNIGMFGSSYVGFVQWHLVRNGSKKLKAIAPAATSGDWYLAPWHSPGGAFSLAIAQLWGTLMSLNRVVRAAEHGKGDAGELAALAAEMADLPSVYEITPAIDRPLVKKFMPWMIDVAMRVTERNGMWAGLSPLHRPEMVSTPALHIGGWYDMFISETLRSYTELKKNAGTAEAREGQYLIVGPWAHSISGHLAIFRGRSFGAESSMEAAQLTATHIAFYDRYLKGRDDAMKGFAPVRIFVMGLNQWRDEQDWPLPDTYHVPYYLDGEGSANSAVGSGRLSLAAPETARTDRYLYNPRRPVPSMGGTTVDTSGADGAVDQSSLHTRADILFFASDLLEAPVEVTGPIVATFYVSSSAVDTDFTAKLVDLQPDGRSIVIAHGIRRMRYRNSLRVPELMKPGEVYEITINVMATSNVFLPGHRIVVHISSSDFPRYERNSNTGGFIAGERLEEMIPARNTLHRGGRYPSHVMLPIIKR